MAAMILRCSKPLLTPKSSRSSVTVMPSNKLQQARHEHNKHTHHRDNKTYFPSTPISWNLGACLASDNGGADSQAHTSATLQLATGVVGAVDADVGVDVDVDVVDDEAEVKGATASFFSLVSSDSDSDASLSSG